MARGEKTCPKCNNIVKGPRTKVCPHCQYIFIPDSIKDIDIGDDDPYSVKIQERKCLNCGEKFQSSTYNIDAYGDATFYFKYEHYCSLNCLMDSDAKKNDLISKLKNLIPEDLKEDNANLLEEIDAKNEAESKWPRISFKILPKKKIFRTSQETKENGLRVPPKIGEYIPNIISEEDDIEADNEVLMILNGKIPTYEEENEKDEDEEEVPPVNELLSILNAPVKQESVKSTSVDYDPSSKPSRGQKKCKQCGLIVGVRTKICGKCNYVF